MDESQSGTQGLDHINTTSLSDSIETKATGSQVVQPPQAEVASISEGSKQGQESSIEDGVALQESTPVQDGADLLIDTSIPEEGPSESVPHGSSYIASFLQPTGADPTDQNSTMAPDNSRRLDERMPLTTNNTDVQGAETVSDFLRAVPGPSGPPSQLAGPVDDGGSLSAGSSVSGGAVEGSRSLPSDLNLDSQAYARRTPSRPESRRHARYMDDETDSPAYRSSERSPANPEQEFALPRWQPDAEMTLCPICGTQFSFFVRKHHCRKCGRVVCNSCSPHRITIPYQYIVQPPEAQSDGIDHHGALNGVGGLKVRLCNPCVPDPNILPPHSQSQNFGESPPIYTPSVGGRAYAFDGHNTSGSDQSAIRARGMSAASGLVPDRRQRSEVFIGRNVQNFSTAFSGSFPNDRMQPRNDVQSYNTRAPVRNPQIGYHSTANPAQARGHMRSITLAGSSSNSQTPYRPLLENSSANNDRPLPPIPRIAEEDECPICHCELASRDLPNFEDVRAAHVISCIDEQIAAHNGQGVRPGAHTSNSQPPPVLAPSTSSPRQTTAIPSPPVVPNPTRPAPTAPGAPIANTPEARTRAREEAHAAVVFAATQGSSSQPSSASSPNRRTGMFPYKATEKDCVDDAECTICLEEFEVGVPMARLECLCRFHKSCIQEWFVGHPGRCPVHQHDGYGF